MEKVSILIAAYNCEKYIEHCLESCINQTYKNIEIIVIDDASSDRTFEILQKLSEQNSAIKIIKNKKNIGYLKTFNRLIELYTGKFVSFVDSDDYIDRRKIEKQINFLKKYNYGACGTSYVQIDEQGKTIKKELLPETHEEIRRALKKDISITPIIGSSIMIRSDILEMVGGYRDFFLGMPGEDFDWACRISEITKIYNLQEYLYYYRLRNNSLTNNSLFTIKNIHFADIVAFLCKERDNNGVDLLDYNTSVLDNFISEIEKKYKKDKGLLYRKQAVFYAKNKCISKSIYALLESCKVSPFKIIKNIKTLLYVVSLSIFPHELLFKIKKSLNLKNISDSV